VLVTESKIVGTDGFLTRHPPQLGVDSTGDLTLVECTVTGGAAAFPWPPVPAAMLAGTTTIAGTASSKYQAGAPKGSPTPTPAISLSGLLVLDPKVMLQSNGGAAKVVGGSVMMREMPVLGFTSAPLSGTAWTVLHDRMGRGYAIFLGLAEARRSTEIGELWIDARSSVLIGAGILDATGQRRIGTSVPNDFALLGAPICAQAVLASPPPMELSNAAIGMPH
jgi:hypothetical protein